MSYDRPDLTNDYGSDVRISPAGASEAHGIHEYLASEAARDHFVAEGGDRTPTSCLLSDGAERVSAEDVVVTAGGNL